MTTGRNVGEPPGRRRRAFTLLELILVMLVISVVLTTASASLRGFFSSRQTSDLATRVLVMTRWAQADAAARGRRCRIYIDEGTNRFWGAVQRAGAFVPAEGDMGRPFELPAGAIVTLSGNATAPGADYIEFRPDGRHDVAAVELIGPQGDCYLVSCETPAEPFRIITPAEAVR